jgi:capsular exopolysaccharide synthesis family protein
MMGIDLREQFARFRVHMLPALAVAAVIVALGVAVGLLLPRQYTAIATILVDPSRSALNEAQDTGLVSPDTNAVDTQVRVLRSSELARAAASDLAGAGGPRLAPQDLLERLEAERVGLTSVIEVRFTDTDPMVAGQVANGVARAYVTAQVDDKTQTAHSENAWIGRRLEELGQNLRQADQAVQQFRLSRGLLEGDDAALSEEEASLLKREIADARAGQSEREARLAAARRQTRNGNGSLATTLDSDALRDLRTQRAEVSRERATLASRYGPDHPRIQRADEALADIDDAISAEGRRQVAALEAEAAVARRRTDSLAGSLAQTSSRIVDATSAGVTLRELERRAETARAVYESFLTRSRQLAAREGGQQADARVMSEAEPPLSPSSPDMRIVLVATLAAALVGAVATVLLLESLDQAVRGTQQLREKAELRTLAILPEFNSVVPASAKSTSPPDYIAAAPLSQFAEAFRDLRISLPIMQETDGGRVLALTSSVPDEGKTLAATCLATAVASMGERVVLVDCDLRRGAVSRLLGANAAPGLVEVLAGQAELKEALRPQPFGYDLLPLSSASPTAENVLSTDNMTALLEQLRGRYDLVILDTAPVLLVADTRTLASRADSTIVLVRWRKTPIRAVAATADLLQAAGANVAGAVLSRVDMRRYARFAYGDRRYYSAGHGKYYREAS